MGRSEPAPQRSAHASAQQQSLRNGRHPGRGDVIGRREAADMEAPVAPAYREVWRAPGDVVIREGPPQPFGRPRSTHGRTSARDGAEKQLSYGGRHSRAMAAVDDFPLVGQREYWANAGDGRRQQAQYPVPPPRKPGLLQRLTGARRDRRADMGAAGERHADEAPDLPVFFRREHKN
jgi:hypothetical protein